MACDGANSTEAAAPASIKGKKKQSSVLILQKKGKTTEGGGVEPAEEVVVIGVTVSPDAAGVAGEGEGPFVEAVVLF